MRELKSLFVVLCSIVLLSSCADSKDFIIDGENVTVEPYGWFNSDSRKNDSIIYEINTGNVVLSVILCETIIVPALLTGDQIYEPVKKKNN